MTDTKLNHITHLALVVVYLAAEEDGWLLDLHLEQIARCTTVPHTIYAAAHRLPQSLQPRLAAAPNLKMSAVPPTSLRSTAEHVYYLEALTRQAVEDGASHIAVLHVDSFPIRRGWAEDLAARLDERTAYITVDTINTALLFFPAAFYRAHAPRYMLADGDFDSPEYIALRRAHDLQPHSGIGYALCAFRNGLGWQELPDTTAAPPGPSGRVFGGLFFHLARASWIRGPRPSRLAGTRLAAALARFSTFLIHRLRRGVLIKPLEIFHGRMLRLEMEPDFRAQYAALQRDPQGYLARRAGPKT